MSEIVCLGRILWLDDSFYRKGMPGRCAYLSRATRDLGYKVACVRRVKHAVRALEKARYDLVIVDVNLDPEDGGSRGAYDFIQNVVVPRKLAFARVTGDMDQVPIDQGGFFQFQKGMPAEGFLEQLQWTFDWIFKGPKRAE